MLQQAIDFRAESEALFSLLDPLAEADFDRPTLFKQWTLNHILQHLHFFNDIANLSLDDEARYEQLFAELMSLRNEQGATLVAATAQLLDGLKGRALLATWHDYTEAMSARFADSDPKARVKWVGLEMSVRSSISARLMETWAHGQAIYDLLGVKRVDADRIKNVAVLGVNTFAWTFANRGEEVPGEKPYLRLTAPSGAVWEWHERSESDAIEGSATEFCQVVTQTRNIADTELAVRGDVAIRWMAFAQCFAGPPQDPPPPGSRHLSSTAGEQYAGARCRDAIPSPTATVPTT